MTPDEYATAAEAGTETGTALTGLDAKRAAYAADTYFVEAYQDAVAVHGAGADEFARAHTGLLLKPEALAARKGGTTLGWLRSEGFDVVSARAVRLDRHTIRALWRYHWNAVTRDHKEVVDRLCGSAPSCYLLVRAPAEVLSARKGPARVARRAPGQLRRVLGDLNTLLNHVHSPDEPADFLRELAVLFDGPARRAVLAASPNDVARVVAEAEASVPRAEADLASTARRLRARAGAGVDGLYEAAARGDTRTWSEIAGALGEAAESFDAAVLGTYLVRSEEPGAEPLLPTVTRPR